MTIWDHSKRWKIVNRTISILIIQAFLLSNVAFALPTKSNIDSVKKQNIIATPDSVIVPRDFGLVKNKFTGNSGKLIIHIQDAHCNYEAQSNIVKIVETLVRNYSLGLVSVEGADGFIDTSWFKAFPDDEVRKEVADYFMKKGEITGPEFLSITTNLPFKLFGAETRSYYIQNLNAFTSSYALKPETEKYFNSIKTVLNRLKGFIYSEELKSLDAKIQDYESKKIQFNDYIRFLQTLAEHHKINLRSHENFFRLMSVLIYEKKIDFNVTDKERSALIDELSKTIDKDQLQQLVAQSITFKSGKISSAEYYAYLKNLAVANAIDLSKKHPNLYNYIIYNAVYSKIENDKLFQDLKNIEIAIKEKLYANDDQRTLEKLSRHIDILLGLINIKLMNGDFDYYEANKNEFSSQYFEDFLRKKTTQYGLAYEIAPPTDAVTQSIPKLEDFYSIAIKRDKALVDNTLAAMKKEKQQIAVLVTGGFHSEGIAKLLEKEGVSYMVVCPSITKDVPTPYIEILTNQRTPLENILVGTAHAKEANVAIPSRAQLITISDSALQDYVTKLLGGDQLKLAIGTIEEEWAHIMVSGVKNAPTSVGKVNIRGVVERFRKGTGASIAGIINELRGDLYERCRRLHLVGLASEHLMALLEEQLTSPEFKAIQASFEEEYNDRIAERKDLEARRKGESVRRGPRDEAPGTGEPWEPKNVRGKISQEARKRVEDRLAINSYVLQLGQAIDAIRLNPSVTISNRRASLFKDAYYVLGRFSEGTQLTGWIEEIIPGQVIVDHSKNEAKYFICLGEHNFIVLHSNGRASLQNLQYKSAIDLDNNYFNGRAHLITQWNPETEQSLKAILGRANEILPSAQTSPDEAARLSEQIKALMDQKKPDVQRAGLLAIKWAFLTRPLEMDEDTTGAEALGLWQVDQSRVGRTSPGEYAVAGAQSGLRKLTSAQNDAYNEILKQSFADGTYKEVTAKEIGLYDPEFKDFKFIVHYGLEARIEKYNKEHKTKIPTDRVHPGRGGDQFSHEKLQAHISSYRYDSLIKGGGLEVLRVIAKHELAHIQISNNEKDSDAYKMRSQYPRISEEDVVDLHVSGANTRVPVLGLLSVRDRLANIDERRADDKLYKMIESLITDTEYGTAARDIYIKLMKEGKETEARDYAGKAYTRRLNADNTRNAFKVDPYEGYDIVVITNSTEDESAVRQDELDRAFKGIRTKSGKPVIAVSITDKSYGGQIIGQVNTERLVMKKLKELGLSAKEIAKMSMVTFHNGGKGERFSPGSHAFDLSRAKQPVGGAIETNSKEELDLTLMLDVIANMLRFAKSSPDQSARGGIRRDVVWANQVVLGTIPLGEVRRSNFAIDKLIVAINWAKSERALMKDLFDYGTALVDRKTGKILSFFANKQITQKNAAGTAYEINPEAQPKYKLLRSAEGSTDLMAALDYGSYSISEDMRIAMAEYWTNYRLFKVSDGKGGFEYKTIFEIMDSRTDGRAIIGKEISLTGKDKAVKRDIDPAFVQIITPLTSVLQRITLPAGIASPVELAKITDRRELYEKLTEDAITLFASLPEGERLAIASAVSPREKEAKLRANIQDAAKYLEANEAVLETIQIFLLFRDRNSIFGDLNKVVGSADLGEDSIWPAYKRLLDMGNEKFQMLNDITGKVEMVELDGTVSSINATDADRERAGCVRRAQGIKDSAMAKFNFAGKDFVLSVNDVAKGVYLSTKDDRIAGQNGLNAYTNSPESGIWIKGSLILGNNTLLPGSSIVNSVIHNSEGRIKCENFYVESSSVLSLSGENNAPAKAGMAIKVVDIKVDGVTLTAEKPIIVDIYHPQLRLPSDNHTRFYVKANHDPDGQKITDWQGNVIKTVESDVQTVDVTGVYNLKQIRETFDWSSTENARIYEAAKALTHGRIAETNNMYATAKALGFGTSGLRADDRLMTDREVYINTLAFINYMLEEGRKGVPGGAKPGSAIDVAGDFRPSTPRIAMAVIAAIIDSGCIPNYCGNIPTPAVTVYGMANNRPSIMVTASHNPYDFKAGHGDNGIKFNRGNGEILKSEEAPILRNVAKVRLVVYAKSADESMFTKEGAFKAINEKADVAVRTVDEKARLDYIERYAKAFGKVFNGEEVIFYQHTAVGRDVLSQIFQKLGASVYTEGRLDEKNAFMAMDTEDIKPEVLNDVRHLAWEHIKKYRKIPFAICSADGDSDRPAMFFVKNTQADVTNIKNEEDVIVEYIPGDKLDVLTCMFLKPDFVATPKTANDMALRRLSNPNEKGGLGAMVLLTEVGSPYVVKAMIDNRTGTGRRVGFEVNGGFFTDQGIDISELLMEQFGGERQGGVLSKLPTRDAALPLISALIMARKEGSVRVLAGNAFGGEYSGFVHAGLVQDKDRDVNPIFDRYTKEAGPGIVKAITPASSSEKKITEVDFINGTVTYENQKTKEITAVPLKKDKELVERMKLIRDTIKKYLSDDRGFGNITKIIYFSGVKIYFDNGNIVTLRPSGNAPQFRVQPICATQERADQIFEMRFDIVGEMLKDYLDGTLGVAVEATVAVKTVSPGVYAVSAIPTVSTGNVSLAQQDMDKIIASILNNYATGEVIVNAMFKDKDIYEIQRDVAAVSNTLNKQYAAMTPEERNAAWPALERYYAAISEKALDVINAEAAQGLQIMVGNTIALQNLIDNNIQGAEKIQITANQVDMLQSTDDKGRSRGLSYLSRESIDGAGIKVAEKEGAEGIYWRGAEGISKLGKNGENILPEAVYTENNGRFDRLVMYTMLHVGKIHTTVFLHNRLPGSTQYISTGRGHFQSNKLDVKRVARGRMIQFADIYNIEGKRTEVTLQKVGKGEFATSIPGSVDYITPLDRITVFNDVSMEIKPWSILKFNPNLKAMVSGKTMDQVITDNLQAINVIIAGEKPQEASYVVINYNGKPVLAQKSETAPSVNQIVPCEDLYKRLGVASFGKLVEELTNIMSDTNRSLDFMNEFAKRPDEVKTENALMAMKQNNVKEYAGTLQALYADYIQPGKPFKILPLLKTYPWGVGLTEAGNFILKNLGIAGTAEEVVELVAGKARANISATDRIGESWLGKGVIAVRVGEKEHYLPAEVLSLFGNDVYGARNIEDHGAMSGITAKILQASTDLSWQIHIAFAEKVTALEKTTVYVGLFNTITAPDFIKATKEGRTDIFNEVTLNPGETLIVPAKCPHAYKAGSVVVEFKDIDMDSPSQTFSFYDRGRLTSEEKAVISDAVRQANYDVATARASIKSANPELYAKLFDEESGGKNPLIRPNKDGLTTPQETLERIASEIGNAGYLNKVKPAQLIMEKPILVSPKETRDEARAEIIGITEGSVGMKYTIQQGRWIWADSISLGNGQPLTVLKGKVRITTEDGRKEDAEEGAQLIIPHSAKKYTIESIDGEAVIVTSYMPTQPEALMNTGFEAIRANLATVRSQTVKLLTTSKAFRKGDVRNRVPGTFRYEQDILSRVSDGKVQLTEIRSLNAQELAESLKNLVKGEEGVNYVVQLTEDEFNSIKDNREIDTLLKNIRVMILPNVKFSENLGIPFIREIESAGVILGNTTEKDINDKTIIAGWLKNVMSKLTGNKAIDWNMLTALLRSPQPGMSFTERINILLKNLQVKIQPYEADKELRGRRELLWSV